MRRSALLFRVLVFSLAVHLAAVALLPPDGRLVESVFAAHLYPAIAPLVAGLTGRVPFSVAALAITALALWVPLHAIVNTVRWRRGRWPSARAALARIAAGYLVVLILAFHAFFLLWGYHYLRAPLESRLGLPSAPPGREALAATARRAIERTNASRVELEPWDLGELDALLDEALARAVEQLEGRPPPFRGRIKASLPSGLLAAFGVHGVISPWSLEAHVDPGLPPPWLAFAAAHEKAHLAGYAPERDASFVAWLALTEAPDARLRYAGHLGVARWFLGAPGAPPLAPGVRRDLEALRAYHARHVSRVLEAGSRRVYRVYLKANRVRAGLADYGRVAVLIHRWQTAARGGRAR